ncbi:MAG: pilus assembly protein [Desulfoarculaceae bacterium]|nr:pilus assembly protein [Desulfoarculaceae bacterium]
MMMKSEKGVSAVEFALIAPLLFVLTFGIIEFALLLFDKAVITNASREGARTAIVYHQDEYGSYDPADVDEIQDLVANYANGYLVNFGVNEDIASTDVGVKYSTDPTNEGSWGPPPAVPAQWNDGQWYVRVTVPYTYDFLVLPNLRKLLKGEFDRLDMPLEGRTIMRMERSGTGSY